MYAIWIANVLALAAIAFLIQKKELLPRKRIFWLGLILKLTAGIALGLVYKYYFKVGDTFTYYDDAIKLAALAQKDIFQYVSFLWSSSPDESVLSGLVIKQPRGLFLSKFGSILSLLSGHNYWLISCYFSMASFLASWFLLKQISLTQPRATRPAIFALLFFPSVVFWTSGFIKESLAMSALFVIVALFLKLWRKERLALSAWVALIISLWILWSLKYYYLAILLPVLVTGIMFRFSEDRWFVSMSRTAKAIVWSFMFIIPLLIASFLHPNFYLQTLLNVIVENHNILISLSSSQDVVHYNHLEPSVLSVLRNIPEALISGFYRPFMWEATTAFQTAAAIENIFLLILTIGTIYSFFRRDETSKEPLGWLILLYSLLLCAFLALSTPNFGTLSRYRMGFLPMLVMLLSYDNILLRRVFRKVLPGD